MYRKEYKKRYYQEHEEYQKKAKERSKQWRNDNPEKIKKYREDNREKNKIWQKSYYKEIRKFIDNYKLSKGCSICGYNKCAMALDLHHANEKNFTISHMRVLKRVKTEIKKCIILCANCHRELHAKLKGEEKCENVNSIV